MSIKSIGLVSLFLALTAVSALAQEFTLSKEAMQINAKLNKSDVPSVPLGKLEMRPAAEGFSLASLPQCANVPSAADATNFSDHAQYYDRDLAGSLKITFFGTGNLDADKSSKVFVREYRKFARCPATDGSGNLLYGVSLRAAVLVDQTDIAAGANFAVAAASATVKQRSVQVAVDGSGFADSGVAVAAASAQNITQSGLKVENYGDFNKAMSAAFDTAVKSAIASMQLVGFEPNVDWADLVKGVATTFALDRMAQGYGCEDAVEKFNEVFPDKRSSETERAIRGTYQAVAKGCDASSPVVKALAESIIGGQRIRRK
jgi:hypothetical protein